MCAVMLCSVASKVAASARGLVPPDLSVSMKLSGSDNLSAVPGAGAGAGGAVLGAGPGAGGAVSGGGAGGAASAAESLIGSSPERIGSSGVRESTCGPTTAGQGQGQVGPLKGGPPPAPVPVGRAGGGVARPLSSSTMGLGGEGADEMPASLHPLSSSWVPGGGGSPNDIYGNIYWAMGLQVQVVQLGLNTEGHGPEAGGPQSTSFHIMSFCVSSREWQPSKRAAQQYLNEERRHSLGCSYVRSHKAVPHPADCLPHRQVLLLPQYPARRQV